MRRALVQLLSIACLAGCGQTNGARAPSLAEGLDLYAQNRLDDASPLFEQAVVEAPRDADAHAWLAETARRQGRHDTALDAARAALAVDPCHAFAYTVLGALYQPIYSAWPAANPDSSWNHLRRAVRCDPADGNAWIGMWPEALRRGESEWEARALESLITTGFLTASVLAYNRWVLEAVPPNALLLTNGDWDTFPALALQRVERLRPDVAVVNLSMLNLPWYAALMRDRHDIPLPLSDAELGAFQPSPGRLLPDTLVAWWRTQGLIGARRRPLVAATTVTLARFEIGPGSLQEAGPFLRFRPETAGADTATMRRAVEAVRGADFAAPEVSPGDRSAVRMAVAAGRPLATVVLSVALQYAGVLRQAGRTDESDAMVRWSETFIADAGLGSAQREMVENFKKTQQPSGGAGGR